MTMCDMLAILCNARVNSGTVYIINNTAFVHLLDPVPILCMNFMVGTDFLTMKLPGAYTWVIVCTEIMVVVIVHCEPSIVAYHCMYHFVFLIG